MTAQSKPSRHSGFTLAFARFANWTAQASGTPLTFVLSALVIVAWAITGPLFHFSDTWQLVINTGTTIVTFLMVFLIQNTQNRDGLAIQVKLDELVRALESANNKFVGIEKLTAEEVEAIRQDCEDAAQSETRVAPPDDAATCQAASNEIA